MTKIIFNDQLILLCNHLKENYFLVNGLNMISWNGKIWEINSEDILKSNIMEWLIKEDIFINMNQVSKFFKKYIEYMKTITIEQLNFNNRNIVFNNGTYNLDNHIFYENIFYKEDFCTKKFELNYNNNSSFKEFLNFLLKTMHGNYNLINLIQEVLGYCLTNSCEYQKYFILYGNACYEKSAFKNIISNVWYKNISNVLFQDCTLNSRTSMYGSRINFSWEEKIKNKDLFKNILNGELVDAKFIYKKRFEFKPTLKMIITSDKSTIINDKDLIGIPFENGSLSPINDELINSIIKENSGIINFAIEGLKRLEKNKSFTEIQDFNKNKVLINKDFDIVDNFLKECCKIHINNNNYTLVDDLYDKYKTWCNSNELKYSGKTIFLRNIHIIVKNSDKVKRIKNNIQKYVILNITLI